MRPDPVNSRITGPTPLPEAVLTHIRQQMLSHRSEQFKQTYRTVSLGLMNVLGCAIPPLLFTSSGTGALEAVVLSLLAREDRVLAISCGYYGDLFASIARRHLRDQVDLISLPAGEGVCVDVLDQALDRANYQAVLLTHNESSTGCLSPLAALAQKVRHRSDALVLVDAVSSIGTTELRLDSWGIDAAVGVTQKGLMAPPGMSIVACSERALARASRKECIGSVAFNFSSCLELARKSQTLTTPCLHAFWGLEKSLSILFEEGLGAVYARHERVSRELRIGLERIGLSVLARSEYSSPGITAATLPEGIDSGQFCEHLLRTYSVAIGVGMGDLRSRVIRIGHMGNVSSDDISDVLLSIEKAFVGPAQRRSAASTGK